MQDNYNNNDLLFFIIIIILLFFYYLEYISSFTYLSLSVYSVVYFMFPVENNMYIYTSYHCYYTLLNICHSIAPIV